MKPLYNIRELKAEFLEWWKTTQDDPEFEKLTERAEGLFEYGMQIEIIIFLRTKTFNFSGNEDRERHMLTRISEKIAERLIYGD